MLEILWGLLLTFGGVSVMAGILWRHYQPAKFISGLWLEQAGIIMLGSAVLIFTIVVILYGKTSSVFTSSINGAFIAACLSRIVAIRKEIGIVREHGDR